jgi:hypothetical protein
MRSTLWIKEGAWGQIRTISISSAHNALLPPPNESLQPLPYWVAAQEGFVQCLVRSSAVGPAHSVRS